MHCAADKHEALTAQSVQRASVYLSAADRLKLSSTFQLWPHRPGSVIYAQTGMPNMNSLNHFAQIGLMRTIWTTVSQTHMNGIPFHTRQIIFHCSHFPFLLLAPFFRAILQTTFTFLWSIDPILRSRFLLLLLGKWPTAPEMVLGY